MCQSRFRSELSSPRGAYSKPPLSQKSCQLECVGPQTPCVMVETLSAEEEMKQGEGGGGRGVALFNRSVDRDVSEGRQLCGEGASAQDAAHAEVLGEYPPCSLEEWQGGWSRVREEWERRGGQAGGGAGHAGPWGPQGGLGVLP